MGILTQTQQGLNFLTTESYIQADGTSVIAITSSGNVGIGTTSPTLSPTSYTGGLHVENDTYIQARLSSSASGAGLEFIPSSGDHWEIQAQNGNSLIFFNRTDSSYRMVIDGSGNVGIGTTSPSVPLTVAANSGGNAVRLLGRSSDGYAFTTFRNNADSATNGEIGISDAQNMLFYTGTSERMRIDSSGNVGIGTTSPTYKLDVNGGIRTSSVTGPGVLDLVAPTSFLRFQANANNIFYDAGGNHYFRTASGASTSMIVTSAGNVGIGTTAPLSKLHVSGGVTINTGNGGTFNDLNIGGINGWSNSEAHRINFVYGNGTSDIFQTIESYYGGANEGKMRFRNFYTNSAQTGILMTIHSNGNVGIGTDSPGGRLELNGSGQSWTTAPAIRMWDSYNSKGWLVGNVNNVTAGDFYIRTLPGEDTNPGTSNNEFTIKHATGNVGIGTTSPSHKLDVNGDIAVKGASIINRASAALTIGDIAGTDSVTNLTLTTAGRNTEVFLDDAGNVGINDTTPSYALDVTGTIRATGDVIAYSDARVKENVETIPNALDKVKAMRGVGYNKIGSEKRSVGVIAQEMLDVIPEVVHTDDQGMHSVAYGNLVGVLIEAMKEQQQQIEELKAIIDGITE